MAPKHASKRAKAKAKAKAVVQKNSRRDARVEAAKSLNGLAVEVGAVGHSVCLRCPSSDAVEKLIHVLERRVLSASQCASLHAAAKQWTDNGGSLHAPVLPEVDLNQSPLGQHRVLQPTFELKACAFMTTYNSCDLTPHSWSDFRLFQETLCRSLGARAWSACLEESLHATGHGRHHCHGYLMWSDGVGFRSRSLDPLYFQGIRPRVDLCIVRRTSSHTAACHGLWYVWLKKDGTLNSDTNYLPIQHYTPQPQWLQNLYRDKKISHGRYLQLSAADFPLGHAARKRDAEEAFRDQH
eukprot:10281659-Karenia_brevis.AAC.1